MRTLVIGLDGYELSLAEDMIAEGLLPHLAALRKRSAEFELDHGKARYSGLAWEHVSTGKSPEGLGHFAAVDFDPITYRVRQRPTNAIPVMAEFNNTRTVVFDMPYCDLKRAENVLGVATWGAHDPGVARFSRPAGLHEELANTFGPYPATEYIYGFVWPSVDETRKAGQALTQAVRVRADAALWLLKERLPDWDLGIVVVSEAHSAIEALWHGVDPGHPLHCVPSSGAARSALRRIYMEIDKLVGTLVDAFPDANVVLFTMHGMGRNNADVASMVLLPELLFRHRFDRPYMRNDVWPVLLDAFVDVDETFNWHFALEAAIPPLWKFDSPKGIVLPAFDYDRARDYETIEWMPTTRYQPFWPVMDVFAVPAFYDGRVRVNLAGREKNGRVPKDRYNAVLEEVTGLLNQCVDIVTGEPVVASVSLAQGDPFAINRSQADLEIIWSGNPTGFVHSKLGTIGPVPYRRPGGHTGGNGFVWFWGSEWVAGNHGLRSSFDVMPTIAAMHNEYQPVVGMSGRPIKPEDDGKSDQSLRWSVNWN